ncbi:DUF3025 domain-containing protein [Leeia sp.]|uniref:DUF3025 domain-containing protein n=1 Tax=Leeia sp. TaxID=2884678 RepID=UPI0035AE3404
MSRFQDWPGLDWLNHHAMLHGLCNQHGIPLRFVQQDAPLSALAFEQQIDQCGTIPCRPRHWHDWFNALIWLRFPLSKAILNQLHVQAGDSARQRGRLRDALTLFDECGIIIRYRDPILARALQQHQWHEVWWQQRQQASTQLDYTLFGHAEYEKGLAPFRGWTAKALYLPDSPLPLDQQLAAALRDGALSSPRDLKPLPVLGVPGWHAGQDEAFYQDQDYFRPLRQPHPAPDARLGLKTKQAATAA